MGVDDHNVLVLDNCNQEVAQDPVEKESEGGNNLQEEQEEEEEEEEEEVGTQVQLDEVSHVQVVHGNEVNTSNNSIHVLVNMNSGAQKKPFLYRFHPYDRLNINYMYVSMSCCVGLLTYINILQQVIKSHPDANISELNHCYQGLID